VYALIREVIKHATRWKNLELLVEVDCHDGLSENHTCWIQASDNDDIILPEILITPPAI